MSEVGNKDDVRELVRRAILDVLGQEHGSSALEFGLGEPSYEQQVPVQKELRITLRGSERMIGRLEQALAGGERTLEIAIDEAHGPKARVKGRLSAS